MAANTYIILISVPGEKAVFFMKRMISFITLAIVIVVICDTIFLLIFFPKGNVLW